MESIISYTSGHFSWMQMKLIWEEVDKNAAANTSKLRLRDIQLRSTTGSTVGQTIESDTLIIYVNGTQLNRSINWQELALVGVPAEFKSVGKFNFDAIELVTGALEHSSGGALNVNITVFFKMFEYVYTSPTTTDLYRYIWNGSGTGEIEGSGSGGGGGQWLTDVGKNKFLEAAGGAIISGAYTTGSGDVAAAVTEKKMTSSGKLAVTLEAAGLEIPASVSAVKLMDKDGNTIAEREDSFSVAAGEKILYYWQFDLTTA